MKIKIIFTLFLCFSHFSFAQTANWSPNRPVRLIIPQVAGGGADAIGRTIGQAISEKIGQPVIVDNRPGTNGGIGVDALMRSPADGHHLLLVFTSLMAITPSVYDKVSYDPLRDLKALGSVCEVPLVMIASSKVPANTFSEFASQIRANPKSVFGASSGNGAFSHMMVEILNQKLGVSITHIPFKGEGPAVQHILSAQDAMFYIGTPAIILSQVQAGKLKALGVTTAKRMAQIPNVPTLAEQGLTDFNESFWYGIAASSDTPQNIVDAYSKVIEELGSVDTMLTNLNKMGCGSMSLNSANFTDKIKNDITKYSAIAKAVKMKVD